MLLRVSKLLESSKNSIVPKLVSVMVLVLLLSNSLQAQEPPTLNNIPANITVECEADAPGDPGTVTATDDCLPAPVLDYEQVVDLSCPNQGFITNIWTATDCEGLMTTGTQIIRVLDETAPDPEDPPADVVIDCPDMVPDPVDLTATDNCSADITVSPVDLYMPMGDPMCIGETTVIMRTWTFLDECDNEASVSQMITINALINPVFNETPLPVDMELTCEDAIPVKDVLTVMDGCGNMLDVMCTEMTMLGICPESYALVRNWTANDCAGNIVTHTQTITILDEEAPEITCMDAMVSLDADGVAVITVMDVIATEMDNCSTYELELSEDNFNCFEVGDNTVTVTATDACGNVSECDAVVTVIDDMAPTCMAEDVTLCLGPNGTLELTPADLSITAEDNCSIASIVLDPEVLTCDNLGSNIIDITVTDINGVETLCSADVTLEDCRNPVLTCIPVFHEITDPALCEEAVMWADPIASGLCPDLLTAPVHVSGPMSGDLLMPGNYVATYMMTATNGAVATCNVDITVEEFQPDGLVCRNINVSLDQLCQSEVTPTMVLGNSEIGCEDHYEIDVWDPHGNSLGNVLDDTFLGEKLNYMICQPVSGLCCWGELIIEDKFPPELTCDPIVISACNGLDGVEVPEADENCSVSTTVLLNEVYENFACDPDYVAKVTRTYMAVDATGAESTPCVQEIYLERPDITDIVFPPNAEVYCDSNFATTDEGYPAPSETGVPTNLDGDEFFPDVPDQFCNTLVTFTDEEVATTDCKIKILRTWEIREWWCTGEITFGGTQFIEIVDHTGPTIVMPDDMSASTTYECEARVNLPSINASDVCGSISSYAVEYPGGFLNTNGGQVMLPMGDNIIKYIVYDDCYNSSYEEMTITVEDSTQPVAACDQNTVVSIPREGWVEVLAEVFDDGSFDDCGLHSFEARRMDSLCNPNDTLFGPTVEFCCTDLDRDIMVALRVTDYAGNTNICMVNVKVQDKILPSISCPADTIIECTFLYDLNNLSLSFGSATSDGNCSEASIIEEVDADLNQCGLGQIGRRFYIGDSENPITECTQWITVVNNSPFNPGSIDWPDHYDTEDDCSIDGLTPERLEYPYNEPLWTDDVCDLIGSNYEDEIFDFSNNNEACVKIIRRWTLINWCQRDLDGRFLTWNYDQIIKLDNTVDPVITGDCNDVVECTFDINCAPTDIRLFREATDDCTPDSLLSWKYEVDFDSDGTIDDEAYTNDTIVNYPLGIHTVYWTVVDRCGNQDQCDYLLEIRSCKVPTPVCIQGLSVDLVPMDTIGNDGIPDAEMATLWASDFDASSFHNCGNDITFSFSQDTTDKFVVYDCEDLGINIVTMWVTDVATGAQDFCQTFIDVQDNNNIDICPEMPNVQPRIIGSISTEESNYVENVMVELMGSELSPEMTNETGEYAFTPDIGFEYEVNPYKNDDPLNGVSTLDLVLIQRHILGSSLLDSPYKLIAADINMDEGVSALDLIELRKLILGIYQDFPVNESWRFVDRSYEFPDANNPWVNALEESYETGLFVNDMIADFVGIKIGDVNGSTVTNFHDTSTQTRSNLSLEMETPSFDNSIVHINMNQGADLYGLQFTIEHPGATISDIYSDVFEISPASIGKFEGKTTISIYSDKVVELSEQETLLTIDFADGINKGLEISSSVTKAEAYNDEMEVLNVQTQRSLETAEFVLYQNIPNPWKYQTVISFTTNKTAELNFRFYNAIGAVLYDYKGTFEKGYNAFEISSDDIGSDGLIFYEVIFEGQKFNKKMILLK